MNVDDPFANVPTPGGPTSVDQADPDPWGREERPGSDPRSPARAGLNTRDAELALIGELLLDPAVVDAIGERLHPRDFSDGLFGRLYARIVQEAAAGRPPTHQTLVPLFAGDDEFAEAGGRQLLAQAFRDARGLDGGGPYVEQIATFARRRRLADKLGSALDAVRDGTTDMASISSDLETAAGAAAPVDDDRPAMTVAEGLRRRIQHIWDVKEGKVAPLMRVAGLTDWNDIVGGGMARGDLIIKAGRPGMGKTALAQGVSRAAASAGLGVLFISREMRTEQLMDRIAVDMLLEAGSRATFEDVREARLDARDMRLMEEIADRADKLPIVVEQPSRLSVAQIGPMIRKHRHGMAARGWSLDVVVVDYLGLLEPPSGKGNREQEVSAISRELKSAAQANGVALIALSQLSRAVESREDKRPHLSDLRDSGALEQDADCVVFVYREEYYLRQAEPDVSNMVKHDEWQAKMRAALNRVEVFSAKVRQGAPTRRLGYFFGSRQAIRNSDFMFDGPA